MPTTHDTFITTLKEAHLKWGSLRHTASRPIIYGEGYLQIPARVARRLNIYNSNMPGVITDYRCTSGDGFLNGVILKASGNSRAGEVHAKQFQGSGDLQILGSWFRSVGAKAGDRVQITWTSPTDIVIEKL